MRHAEIAVLPWLLLAVQGEETCFSHPATCHGGEAIAELPLLTSMVTRQKCFLGFQLSHDTIPKVFLACLPARRGCLFFHCTLLLVEKNVLMHS